MKQISKYAIWSFRLIIVNLFAWFSLITSVYGLILTQWSLFIFVFILFPIASLILGILAIKDIKKNHFEGYGQTLFSIIASIISLILLFIFGNMRLF